MQNQQIEIYDENHLTENLASQQGFAVKKMLTGVTIMERKTLGFISEVLIIVDLFRSSTIKSITGSIDNKENFSNESMDTLYQKSVKSALKNESLTAVTNGGFFDNVDSPTTKLSHGLKIDGKVVSHGSKSGTEGDYLGYPQQLFFGTTSVKVKNTTKNIAILGFYEKGIYEKLSCENMVGGISATRMSEKIINASGKPWSLAKNYARARTAIGFYEPITGLLEVKDISHPLQTFRKVCFYTANSFKRTDTTIRDFDLLNLSFMCLQSCGAQSNIMFLDGGYSTFLSVTSDKNLNITTNRKVPHAFAIYSKGKKS